MYYRNMALLAKLEVSYGTDPVPTGGANAILTKGLTIQPYNGARVSRDLDRSTFGAQSEINTGAFVTVSFGVELAGSGTAGTAPAWGPLIQACGFTETDGASDVVYAPTNTALKSVTIYFYVDGQQHKVIGARGNFSLTLARGQIPTIQFTFTGKYTRPTAVANPALTLTAFQSPVAVTEANTPTWTLFGHSGNAESFQFDMGNQVVYRNVINSETIELTDRNCRGSCVIEAVAVGTENYFANVESHAGVTLDAVSIVHGTTAGNIVTVGGPKVQLASLAMNNSDGILTYGMDMIFTPNAGNDEVTITLT
jgi:hypothetical protein